MPFQIVQIIYWLALSTWFGGVLFIAIAAPIIFQTIRDANPVLPNVLSVNLDGQHGTVLAGSIVANLLARLSIVQLVCGGTLVLASVAQFFLINLVDRNFTAAVLRACMIAVALAIAVFDRVVVWPRLFRFRQEYLDHADEPDVANPAKDNFDREHHRSVTLLSAILFLLLGTILFSANISPGSSEVREPAHTSHSP
ncbi:MAG TPA: DUF4149 domain-containing protein [Tepidisphaeraceae bacterium]|nr:DUF4149 domain-containing protein [Tepidisphaeraceae bacterium]